MKNRLRFSYDSRDYHVYQRFGQTFDLDTPQNFDDATIPEKIQPIGNVECTCYCAEYIAQNKTKKEYDIDELFSRVPHGTDGADPRDVFKEAITNGLKVKGTSTYEKPFSSYWRADTGQLDGFDNVRSSMIMAQSPIAIGSYWHQEWLYLPAGAVMPIGKTPVSGHMYASKGWITGVKTVDGKPHFIIEYWGGQTLLMPRETFNAAMKPYGMGAWVLSDAEIDAKKVKSLTEWIKDLCINLIIQLRDRIKTYHVEPVVPAPIPEAVIPPTAQPEQPKYLWDTRGNIIHSCRVIMDEHHLNWVAKATLCSTIEAESNFNIHAVNKNKDGSMDYGIIQANTKWYIGHGKPLTSIEEALNDPEKCIRVMIGAYQRGHLDDWIAFRSGAYKKYLDRYL